MARRTGKRGPIDESRKPRSFFGGVSPTRKMTPEERYKRQAKTAGYLPPGYFGNPKKYADVLTPAQKARVRRTVKTKYLFKDIYGFEK